MEDAGGEWVPVQLRHARYFSVEARPGQRRLTVLGPGGAGDTIGVHVVELQAGRSPRLAVASTTHLVFLEALGRLDAVVGMAHADRLIDAELAAALASVPDIGRADGMDRELLLALRPVLLLDHPFGRRQGDLAGDGVVRLGITEYLEEHPLGRAEWIRFFGVLLGMEHAADSLFAAIEQRYGAAIPAQVERRPTVFFGSAWQGRWYVPPANSYMATLIADAGGAYLFAGEDSEGNITLDLETVIDRAGAADHFGVILAAPHAVSALDLVSGEKRLAALGAVRNGGFVGNSAVNDLFGKALLEPDVVLRDLGCIFRPQACGGHEAAYFAPLAQ